MDQNSRDLLITLNTKMSVLCKKVDKLDSTISEIYEKFDNHKVICDKKMNEFIKWRVFKFVIILIVGALVTLGGISYNTYANLKVHMAIAETIEHQSTH